MAGNAGDIAAVAHKFEKGKGFCERSEYRPVAENCALNKSLGAANILDELLRKAMSSATFSSTCEDETTRRGQIKSRLPAVGRVFS